VDRRRVIALLVVAAAACGGSTTTSEQRADQARQAAADAGLGDDVQDFLGLAASAVDATYVVTYATAGTGSTPAQEVLVAQRPPDRRVDIVSADGEAQRTITVEGVTHACARPAGDDWVCQETDTDDAAVGIFDDEAIADFTAALRVAVDDYDFTVGRRPVAGTEATCLVTRLKDGRTPTERLGRVGTLCLSPEGVVLLAAEPGRQLEASSYRTAVDDDTFELPAEPGATGS
jgi:hypothetical protein